MASLKASTISTNSSSRPNTTINPRYPCYWLDSCRGLHELNQCPHWNAELRGKLGVYYSSIGIYKRFSVDKLSHVSLKGNPTGRTMVHLLIYTIRSQGEIEILFGLSRRKNTSSEETRCPLLSLPLTRPRKRGESGMQMARRTLEWVTNRTDIDRRDKDADQVTENFIANEEILSLYWFSLTTVLERLPKGNNFIIREATDDELAQHEHINPIGIQLDEYCLWPVTAQCLMCIREYVPDGFTSFLQV